MKNKISYSKFIIASIFLILLSAQLGFSQVKEPELREDERVATDLNELYRSGISFNVSVNNFGLALGGDYRRVISSQSELIASVRFTGLRDVTEQTFTDIFFGQQIIPNKFQRAFAFPLVIGLRNRLFADRVQDNYRFFITATGGPVAAFSYPYFDDVNNNGYREQFQNFFEPVNDIFTGLSDGQWHLGAAGEVKLGMDLGSNFSRLTSIEFGYYFNFFPNGIQMMMPNQPDLRTNFAPGESPFQFDDQGQLLLEPFFDPQKWFGTPQITLTFGRLW